MIRDFVLRVHHVNLLVRVIDENILCAMFLHALGSAIRMLCIRALHTALTVGNIACPGTTSTKSEKCRSQRGARVDRADAAGMASAPRLQQVQRLGAAHLADRDAVGPQAQRGADQIGQRGNAILCA